MKLSRKILITLIVIFTTMAASSSPAKSQKQADYAFKTRVSIYHLLGSNMGPLGGMLKGQIPFNAEVVERNALRMNQLSMMIADALKTDTSKFKLKTEALDNIWVEKEKFAKKIKALTMASAALHKIASSGDEKAIKKAMGAVGKTCGSCHDDFKAE